MPNLNIYNVLILAGIIHGFIFSAVILFNKNLKSKTNFFLALTILSMALSNLQYWFIDTNIIPKHYYYSHNIIFVPFEFLMIPFFYLFIKSYLNLTIKRSEKRTLFLPFFLTVFYLLIVDLLDEDSIITRTLNLLFEYLSIIFTVLIIFFVFKIIYSHERKNTKIRGAAVKPNTSWLKNILYLGLFLCILWFTSLNLFDNLFSPGYYQFYPLWIGISILIYWIGYTALLQRHIFQDRKAIRETKSNTSSPKPDISVYNKIDKLIMESKMHLDPNISLKLLSDELKLSEGYISQLINKH